MKTVIKNVYYCDHCKKRSLSAASMLKHEGHCTANPDRYCRLCGEKNIKETIESLKQRFELVPNNPPDDPWNYPDLPPSAMFEYTVKWVGEPITLQEVRGMTGNCPNCIFAILRQVGLHRHYFEFENFEYRKELSEELDKRRKEYQHDWY